MLQFSTDSSQLELDNEQNASQCGRSDIVGIASKCNSLKSCKATTNIVQLSNVEVM